MADQEENVVIQAGECTATLLPLLGGKIASLRVLGRELLQAPLHPYAPRTRSMPFSEGDASGWDECLPSVGECIVETQAGSASIPDHGDLWRVPWQVLDATQDSATLRAKCFSLPLQLTRSTILSETPTGWELQLLYSLTNMGAYRVPWTWSAHPGFAVEAGDRILLPPEVTALRLEGSGGQRLGHAGQPVSWPLATVANSPESASNNESLIDLGLVLGPESQIGDKLFAGPMSEGWGALERPSAGLRLSVHFDPALTPFLGLWICYGGWPESPGLKQFCVAMEPTTAPADSLAAAPEARFLDPGETCNWPMTLKIDRLAADARQPGESAEPKRNSLPSRNTP